MTTINTKTGQRFPVIRGGEVGLCLTRIHHNRFTTAVGEVSAVHERLVDRGIAFEADVIDRIVASSSASVAVVNNRAHDTYEATTNLLTDGVDIVIGGRIRSPDGSLVGAPDLLVRLPDGYGAIEVKSHKVLGDTGAAVNLAPLENLTSANPSEDLRFRSFRKRDLLQVAHYWRILDSLGIATAHPVGGVIGTDEPIVCTWVDLDAEDSSLVEEAVIWSDAAREVITHGSEHPESPLETAWWRGECRRCEWELLCHAQLVELDDPTLINGITNVERAVLAEAGITTGAAIAALEPDDDRIAEPQIVFDARVKASGRLLRTDESQHGIEVPSARREVDFDIETYGGRIYLAGFLVTENDESRFDPVVDWVGNHDTERIFVEEMFGRLASYGDEDTVVLHWSDYERMQLVAAGKRHDLTIQGYASVSDWFDQHAIDLYQWTRTMFESPTGFSLKAIAPLCGFHWRDDDPGGLQSEIWYEMMLAGDELMRERLLQYNEDDVAAQRAIRTWIRANDNGNGPGSSIPSVRTWRP